MTMTTDANVIYKTNGVDKLKYYYFLTNVDARHSKNRLISKLQERGLMESSDYTLTITFSKSAITFDFSIEFKKHSEEVSMLFIEYPSGNFLEMIHDD